MKAKTQGEFRNRKVGEAKAARSITALIDTILSEIRNERDKAADALPIELTRRFFFESGKVSAFTESIKRLEDLRGLVVSKYEGFKVK
jgi:hypothetical protein